MLDLKVNNIPYWILFNLFYITGTFIYKKTKGNKENLG